MSPVFTKDNNDDWFLPADVREQLKKTFKDLDSPVILETFARPGFNDEFSQYMIRFCTDLARLSDKITVRTFQMPSSRAEQLGITASPTLCVNPDEYHIRFLGAPIGEEGKSFITAIMLASLGMSGLSEASRPILEALNEERLAQVFVSPT